MENKVKLECTDSKGPNGETIIKEFSLEQAQRILTFPVARKGWKLNDSDWKFTGGKLEKIISPTPPTE